MTLYMIGLGLFDEKDITLRGLEIVKRCHRVYMETYTSSMSVSREDLEEFYKKDIIPASRDLVEKDAENTILHDAQAGDTAFLVIGDPFGATTHTDLRMRAKELGIEVRVIHNASILNAIGIIGLELYKFGKVTSIPFENKNVKTPFEVFRMNDKASLHTLFLLDLDPEKKKFMTIEEGIKFLIDKGLNPARKCVGCAGIGSDEPEIHYSKADHLADFHFTKSPQCIIIPSKLHFVEEDALKTWDEE